MAYPVKLLRTKLPIRGLSKPLRILHVTDVHLCECDRRDPKQEKALAYMKERQGGPKTLGHWRALLSEIPRLKPDFVALTGDFADSFTQANWEAFTTPLKRLRVPYGLAFGNHDWDLPESGTQVRATAYRRKLWTRFKRELGRSPEFQAFRLGPLQLVFLDNSDYQVSPGQLRRFQGALQNPGPILLFFHIPLALASLRPRVLEKWYDPILCGEPDWEPLRRRRWRVLSEDLPSTWAFRRAVLNSRRVAAAFTGHVHFDHGDSFPSGSPQYVTPPLYEGFARLVTLIPAS